MSNTATQLHIYQPMMFVGLGGTGCAIGTEVERRLRQALCGPDGSAFATRMQATNSTYLPFQLPACVQFVYADLNEAELDRIYGATVPGAAHHGAASKTAHLVRDLVPQFDTYPDVAASLRLAAGEYVRSWLPPEDDEPLVNPINRGAGQLPTVGRAALFETLRDDLAPAQYPITAAIDALAKANGELRELGGKSSRTCDVFVAFSVAGGTGTGIFYDYLHLIGDAFARANIGLRIYPLVLMPSAFEEGKGGGRYARLNSGRALLDLFRLVDDQNARRARGELDQTDGVGGDIDVRYPARSLQLRPGTVQTAFLFSRTAGMKRDDIHRSIASLVLSLVSAEQTDVAEEARVRGQTFQSFADSFINGANDRSTPADSGIGYRGVSTSLVASLTVPGDELAELVGNRLLARATAQLFTPPPGGVESNRPLIQRFMYEANLGELLDRPPLPVPPPRPTDGASEILRSLKSYADTMYAALHSLEIQLRQRAPEMASQRFQPLAALLALLGETDLFRVRRVMRGHNELTDPIDREGVAGLLSRRKALPQARPGIGVPPPMPPDIRDRRAGMAKVRWADPVVQGALGALNEWYQWNTWRLWHEAWSSQSRGWERTMGNALRSLDAMVGAFEAFALGEQDAFDHQVIELTRERQGVTLLLPAQGRLDIFYETVVRRFIQRGNLREGALEADVVRMLLAPEDWRQAFREGAESTYDRGAERAVSYIREKLKQQVKRLFELEEDDDLPLLPSLGRLLARAADRRMEDVNPADLRQFEQQVAALLPAGFQPQGTGDLKILISHPETKASSESVQRYLRESLALPSDRKPRFDFQSGTSDSIAVVLFRTSMAVNEVQEVRELLREWSDALGNEQPADYLRWRQRLGYEYGWLATAEPHRVLILHRLMCAMWNGQVEVTDGVAASPRAIRVRATTDPGAAVMTLRLRQLEQTSSWGSLLSAYEEWTLADDSPIRRQFASQLRAVRPDGQSQPSPIYATFVEVASGEAAAVQKARNRLPVSSRAWADQLLGFWEQTYPTAEGRSLGYDRDLVRANLRDLYAFKTGQE
ncbi:tubulin-like doman-containing protein [Frankia sp. CNm7]|uniref:Tubulin-like doman-containing protein n=1 Tax=Frankia nepalensis TaxID=1836974 RepID=A0A937RPF8_9ACTN|nr:tubulin-like doman-containing protein [Frankia nepalensis]MBL7502236.1 tubulin-like doman-containing protein [Frankia nepalensis]MBL7516289.1 tubulin-like doman-containing protein [Frankia nepalensis]MBL7523375.1 tubulin-like doman-containing protein [Frankia nepalensis]MBL7632509.1 tubulin-like doman-containing protein [Frankia nepalensis]